MQKTKIEWTDMSWNPVTGCLHGCDYCYARNMSKRFNRSFEPCFHEDRVKQPLFVKGNQKIFVCSMADLFGEWVPREWVERVLYFARLCNEHTFQFLTKNPKRLLEFDFSENCWVGCTATNQLQCDDALTVLCQFKRHVTFLSCEPLLDCITFSRADADCLDWLIIGACSNPKPSQPEKEWVTNMIDFADEHDIPVFLKPNLKVVKADRKEFPIGHGVEVQSTLL